MTTAKHGSDDAVFRNHEVERCAIIMALVAVAFLPNQAALFVKAEAPIEPHPANAMWIEPSCIDLSTHIHTVGYKFNVTVWVNVTSVPSSKQVVTAWQFVITFDKTELNATRCGYTGGNKSLFFFNVTTVSVGPQFGSFNVTCNFVMHGESWLSGPKRTVPGYGSLSWVEFEVIAKPPEGQVYTSLIDLVTTGTRTSKILDDTLSKVSFTSYPTAYGYGPAEPIEGTAGTSGYKLFFKETMNNSLDKPIAINYYWRFSIDKWSGTQWVGSGISGSTASVLAYSIPALTTQELPYSVYLLPSSGSNGVKWGDWLRISFTFHWNYSGISYSTAYVAKLNVHPGDIAGAAVVPPYFGASGKVEVNDLMAVAFNWNKKVAWTGSFNPLDAVHIADIDMSGKVDIGDLMAVAYHWNQQWAINPPPG
jgi:hypothetical protein